jgi:hypothetical protein
MMDLARFRTAAILFVGGGVLLSICDAFHTRSGTTAYARVWALGMAWWTFPVFGGFVALAGLAYARLRANDARPAAPLTAAAVVAFVALYAASAWLPGGNTAKLIVLFGGAVLLWGALDRTPRGALLAFGVAVIGTLGEIMLIAQGAFSYARPDVLGVPVWLPMLYAAGATALGHAAAAIVAPVRGP